MKTNQGSERMEEQSVGRGIAGLGRSLQHEKVIGLYLGGCVALTVIAAALLLSSCGGEHTQVASRTDDRILSEDTAVPAVASQPAAPAMNASTQPVASDTSNEGLPPEIALGEIPNVVMPGEPVAITVYGTPDVTEMSLWDGLNDRQALVHDANGDVWRVDYRVPLRPKSERLGLSVTAKNDQGRWRRLWVFLQVASDAQADDAAAQAPAHVAVVDSIHTN